MIRLIAMETISETQTVQHAIPLSYELKVISFIWASGCLVFAKDDSVKTLVHAHAHYAFFIACCVFSLSGINL